MADTALFLHVVAVIFACQIYTFSVPILYIINGLGVTWLGVSLYTWVLWGTKMQSGPMGLLTYVHVVGVITGIRGSLYHVNALRLRAH